MSVTTVRNFLEKSGCALFVVVALGVVLVAGLWLGGGGFGPQGQENPLAHVPVVRVGGTSVTLAQVDALERLATQRMLEERRRQDPNFEFGPADQGGILAGAIFDLINYAIFVEEAKKRGIPVTVENAPRLAGEDAVKRMNQQFRPVLEAMQKMKAGATEAEFDKALQEMGQPSLASVRQNQANQVAELVKNKDTELLGLGFAAQIAVEQAITRAIDPTEAQVKENASTLVLQRVLIKTTPQNEEQMRARAETVLNEIRGGLVFGQAMTRYSQDSPNPDKKLADSIIRLPVSQRTVRPVIEDLLKLKPNEVSEVLRDVEGLAIYRLQSVEAPTDFENNKAIFRDQFIQQQARAQMDVLLEKERPTVVANIEDSGIRALMNLQLAILDRDSKPDWQNIYDEAVAAMADAGPGGARAALFAKFESHNRLWATLTEAQKAERREQRLEVLSEVLQNGESVTLRLEKVDLLKDLNSGEAGRELVNAAMANNLPSAVGQRNFSDIAARLLRLEAAKLITPEQKAEVEKEQTRWAREKREWNAEMERMRKEEEEQRKQAEAAAKAEAEAAKKAQPLPKARDEAPGKAAPPAAPSSSDLTGQGKR